MRFFRLVRPQFVLLLMCMCCLHACAYARARTADGMYYPLDGLPVANSSAPQPSVLRVDPTSLYVHETAPGQQRVILRFWPDGRMLQRFQNDYPFSNGLAGQPAPFNVVAAMGDDFSNGSPGWYYPVKGHPDKYTVEIYGPSPDGWSFFHYELRVDESGSILLSGQIAVRQMSEFGEHIRRIADGTKRATKYIKIPVDPMQRQPEWGLPTYVVKP